MGKVPERHVQVLRREDDLLGQHDGGRQGSVSSTDVGRCAVPSEPRRGVRCDAVLAGRER